MNESSRDFRRRTIDSHQHVFWEQRNDVGLISDMNEQVIDLAWLLTWEIAPFEEHARYHGVLNPLNLRADGSHAGIPLRDLVTVHDRYPDRFVLGYCPHPLLGDAPCLLRAAHAMYGIQVCGEWKFRLLLDDPRCLELFDVAGELKMPVVLHLDVPYLTIEGRSTYQQEWYGGTCENLERVLQVCPKTIFIGHAPGFWREISGDAAEESAMYPTGPVMPGGALYRLFDEYSNLYADLSARSARTTLARDSMHAKQFITRFADRLLFGRDCYGGELQAVLQTLKLPEDVLDKIYWRNAENLLAG